MWKLSASARGGLHARVGRQSAEPLQMETALTCELVEESLPTFPQQLLEPHIWKLPTGLLPGQEAGRQGVGIHGNREEGKREWELPSGAGSQPRGKQRLFSLSVTCWPGCQDPFVSGHGLCTCGIPGRCLDLHARLSPASGLPSPQATRLCSRCGLLPLPQLLQPIFRPPPGSSPFSELRPSPPCWLVFVLSTRLEWQTPGTGTTIKP